MLYDFFYYIDLLKKLFKNSKIVNLKDLDLKKKYGGSFKIKNISSLNQINQNNNYNFDKNSMSMPLPNISNFVQRSEHFSNLNQTHFFKQELTPHFYSLKILLIKIFLKDEISPGDVDIKPYEKTLLKSILIKKNFKFNPNIELTVALLNNLKTQPLKKKKEYNLKFVMLRTINHMKEQFYKKLLKSKSNEKEFNSAIMQNHDLSFYEFYFKEFAESKNIPIEKFYVFKNWTHRYNKNIPKSITSRTINLWKSSEDFVNEINAYLRKKFLDDFKMFNRRKIIKMVEGWAKQVEKFGLDNAIKSILSSLSSRGCKLPWTLSEAEHGIRETLAVFEY
jgi:hypothetical protein